MYRMFPPGILHLAFLLLSPPDTALPLQACGSALHDKLMEHCSEMAFPILAAKQELLEEGGMSNDVINDVIQSEIIRRKEGKLNCS